MKGLPPLDTGCLLQVTAPAHFHVTRERFPVERHCLAAAISSTFRVPTTQPPMFMLNRACFKSWKSWKITVHVFYFSIQ